MWIYEQYKDKLLENEHWIEGGYRDLIDPAYEESLCETVTREYLKAFPHLEGKYSVHICESADGVKLS